MARIPVQSGRSTGARAPGGAERAATVEGGAARVECAPEHAKTSKARQRFGRDLDAIAHRDTGDRTERCDRDPRAFHRRHFPEQHRPRRTVNPDAVADARARQRDE